MSADYEMILLIEALPHATSARACHTPASALPLQCSHYIFEGNTAHSAYFDISHAAALGFFDAADELLSKRLFDLPVT